ncbi:hypothetical protein ACVIWU_006607 [Bradyrhizobium sp. USDA 4509]
MPHDTGASVGKLQFLHRGKKGLDFHLDSLCQKLPRTGAQDIGQWIIDLVGLTKRDNVASLVYGLSLSLRGSGRLDTRLDTPPISVRHPPLSRIAPADMGGQKCTTCIDTSTNLLTAGRDANTKG